MVEYNGIINISEPENDYCIYKMYSENKEDTSLYIGVTKNYKSRVYKHSVDRKRKEHSSKPLYIWLNNIIENELGKIIFELIEKELSEEHAFLLEIEYIRNYKELGFNVLNLSEGGKGHKGYVPWNKNKTYSKELIKKLSKAHIGIIKGMKDKNHSEETKRKISLKNKERLEKGWTSPKRKKVYKYSSDKKVLLDVYDCLDNAAKRENVSLTTVGEWCRNKKKPRNGFVYSYSQLN